MTGSELQSSPQLDLEERVRLLENAVHGWANQHSIDLQTMARMERQIELLQTQIDKLVDLLERTIPGQRDDDR